MENINKLSFEKLRDMGYENQWQRAVIVFKPESYTKEYIELERSYEVSSSDKGFTKDMNR